MKKKEKIETEFVEWINKNPEGKISDFIYLIVAKQRCKIIKDLTFHNYYIPPHIMKLFQKELKKQKQKTVKEILYKILDWIEEGGIIQVSDENEIIGYKKAVEQWREYWLKLVKKYKIK